MDSNDCEAVQLHSDLESFQCTYCSHLTSWNCVDEMTLSFRKNISCSECISIQEEQWRKRKRMNISVEHLQLNIILFDNIHDSLSKRKARIIDNDAKLKSDILLIISTSLVVNSTRYKLKNKLISAICHNKGKIIYINNNSPPKAFFKPVTDHILEMNYNLWVWDLAAHKPSLWGDEVRQASHCLLCEFHFQLKATTIDEIIKKAEIKLIFIDDYSDIQFRLRTKKEVTKDLSCFLSQQWLSTFLLMCLLSLFEWDESIKVLHSKYTDFSLNEVQKRKKMLKGPVWSIR